GVDQVEEFGAFFIVLPDAIGFESEEFANAERGFIAAEVFGRDVVASEILVGNVNAAERIVFTNIADDIRELEREAEFFSKVERAGILEAENVSAGEADSAGDAIAIFAKAVKGWIDLDGEVHFCARDEVVEVARGHVVTTDGVRERRKCFGGMLRV